MYIIIFFIAFPLCRVDSLLCCVCLLSVQSPVSSTVPGLTILPCGECDYTYLTCVHVCLGLYHNMCTCVL